MKDFYKDFHPSVETTLATKTEHKVGERILGEEPKTGKPVSVKIGRFGPVVQIGTADDTDKPRFAQMKKGQSMETITLEEALDASDLMYIIILNMCLCPKLMTRWRSHWTKLSS